MDNDYGNFLDGWGDYMDNKEEERWWDTYEAAQEKWRAMNPEEDRKREQDRATSLAAYQKTLDLAQSKRAKKRAPKREPKAKPVFYVPSGSVMTRQNTILDPDGWETVVPRGSSIRFNKAK